MSHFHELESVISQEAGIFQNVQVPIITVSATYRKELLKQYQAFSTIHAEAIYSRAHYSMAEAVRQAAVAKKLSSHVIDPLNFVATNDWSKVDFTEFVGQKLARYKPLKWLKDQIDSKARNKLPITKAITPVLLRVTENVDVPLVSMHYEAGNIAVADGKQIIQVITDPHVRPQYLEGLEDTVDKLKSSEVNTSQNPINLSTYQLTNQIIFAVFDKQTKEELIDLASEMGKAVSEDQIVVTGPPVDPRISKLSKDKTLFSNDEPLKLAVTTGGVGTNLAEIKQILDDLVPLLKSYPEKIRLFLYAGTHRDFRNFYEDYAHSNNVRVGNIDDVNARIRILYEDSIVDANENLIAHMFPWADAILTKPSGDMAYEAVAAGIVPLFLEPWGEWEKNVRERLLKKKVAYNFHGHSAYNYLSYLIQENSITKTQRKVKNLDSLYRNGASEIVKLQQKLSK